MIFLLLSIFFVFLLFFFSGIETGLVSLLKPRVQHAVKQNVRSAQILDFFIRNPGYMLATALIGTNISLVCSSNMMKQAFELFGFRSAESMLGLACIWSVVLLGAEIVSKDWFRQQPFPRCSMFAGIFYFSYMILYVPVKIFSKFTTFINKIFGRPLPDEEFGRKLLREDFMILFRESENAGVIDSQAADILDRILELSTMCVRSIMHPIDSVVLVPSSSTVAEAVRLCGKTGKSRVPVIQPVQDRNSPPGLKGIFSVYDAIFAIPEDEWDRTRVTELMRPIVTVPAESELDEILLAAKRFRSPLLVVSEKNGAYSGIVTTSDVIRHLLG